MIFFTVSATLWMSVYFVCCFSTRSNKLQNNGGLRLNITRTIEKKMIWKKNEKNKKITYQNKTPSIESNKQINQMEHMFEHYIKTCRCFKSTKCVCIERNSSIGSHASIENVGAWGRLKYFHLNWKMEKQWEKLSIAIREGHWTKLMMRHRKSRRPLLR